MKHFFYINPTAGQGKGTDRLTEEIKKISHELEIDSEIYITQSEGDGLERARRDAVSMEGRAARFYACGGDGTNNEIINAVAGIENTSVACIPTGTGNDLIRNFPEGGDFTDIRAQIMGDTRKIDLIKYSGIIGGKMKTGYCANMFNIGFDCNVVEMAGRLKKKPLIAGSMAYLLAVFGMFIKKDLIGLRLIEDGRVILDDRVLLCAIANGSYCGGGIKSSPQSVMSDGEFDVNIMHDVTRRQFLRLFPSYQKGTHIYRKDAEGIMDLRKCRKLRLEPHDGTFFLCVDGEISISEAVEFEIVPSILDFVIPAKHNAEYIEEQQTERK